MDARFLCVYRILSPLLFLAMLHMWLTAGYSKQNKLATLGVTRSPPQGWLQFLLLPVDLSELTLESNV